jgi:hypothetical protein
LRFLGFFDVPLVGESAKLVTTLAQFVFPGFVFRSFRWGRRTL